MASEESAGATRSEQTTRERRIRLEQGGSTHPAALRCALLSLMAEIEGAAFQPPQTRTLPGSPWVPSWALMRWETDGRRLRECAGPGMSFKPSRTAPGDIRRRDREAVDARRIPRHEAPMSSTFPPCPYLPAPRAGLDWRALHVFRATERGAAFYFACLEYGHALWQRGFAARALLCLDRAFGADLTGGEPVLREHPLPYASMAWLIAHTPSDVFLGNPRVHFQHYADRVKEPRREQRRWRAWACWAIARAVRPDLPGDPKHNVVEPTLHEISAALQEHGHRGEAGLWRAELERAGRLSVS